MNFPLKYSRVKKKKSTEIFYQEIHHSLMNIVYKNHIWKRKNEVSLNFCNMEVMK